MASARFVIASFKHRVAVCSMKDVVEQNGTMSLTRADVYHAWAKIVPSVKSMFSSDGYAVKQSADARTHKIVIRFRRDLDITSAAWLYEERLQSGNRWFKVLAIAEAGECGEYLEMDCRLVERGVETSPPVDPVATLPGGAVPLPKGVSL